MAYRATSGPQSNIPCRGGLSHPPKNISFALAASDTCEIDEYSRVRAQPRTSFADDVAMCKPREYQQRASTAGNSIHITRAFERLLLTFSLIPGRNSASIAYKHMPQSAWIFFILSPRFG